MKKEDLIIHDIEIYKNFFSDIFKIPGKNDLIICILFEDLQESTLEAIRELLKDYKVTFILEPAKLIRWLKQCSKWLIGYNSHGFDDPILNYLNKLLSKKISLRAMLLLLKREANEIILNDSRKHKYNIFFKGLDAMRIAGLDRIKKPLKQVLANLKHDLILDLPIVPEASIKESDIIDIIYYQFFVDILGTEKLVIGLNESQISPTIPKTAYTGLIPSIKFREDMKEVFNVDLLNYNTSQIGEKLARKLYSEVSGKEDNEFKDLQTIRTKIKYSDVIFDNVIFETEDLQNWLIELKSLIFNASEYGEIPKSSNTRKNKYLLNKGFKKVFELFGMEIVFAQGGLHGIPINGETIIEVKDDEYHKDIDGASYYPLLYWLYSIKPEHLPEFTEFVKFIILTRLKYKKEGNKVYSNGLKIPINRIYGGFNDVYGWMLDLKALLQTTINGQLFLLMLMEKLHLSGIKVFYANTDGITCIFKKSKLSKFKAIWKWWEDATKMQLEDDDFNKFFIKNVNNYIIIKKNGKTKLKGQYEYTSYIEKYGEFNVTGSFKHPITSYAVHQYYIHNIPLAQTIEEHRDIYDFTICMKVGKQYQNLQITLGDDIEIKELQRTCRYFISNSNKKLYKVKNKSNRELRSLLKKQGTNSYFLLDEIKDFSGKIIAELDDKYLGVIEQGEFIKSYFKEWLSYAEHSAGWNNTIFNKAFFLDNWDDYDINYEYYIKEAEKLLLNPKKLKVIITEQQLKLF